jgi:hypothetical protein
MSRGILIVATLLVVVSAVYGDAAEEARKVSSTDTSDVASRDRLLDRLFRDYKNYNYPENATVKLGLAINKISFCEEHDLMNTYGWLQMMWNDNRLTWSKEETGISTLRVPPSKVWLPDVTLYNNANPKMELWETNVVIYPTGSVLWVPPYHLQSFCNLTSLMTDPYKEQTCPMKFGSWTFDQLTIGLEFFDDTKHFADTTYYNGRKYKVTTNTAVIEDKHYDCCVEPYRSILYTIGVTQQTPAQRMCASTHN